MFSNENLLVNNHPIRKFCITVATKCHASCSSILPTVLPIFTYDYKEKNERQEARGKSLFINAEHIQASVITCLRKNGEL